MNHIALICDDFYALPTAVTIQSIKDCAENFCNCKLCIHVCTSGLTAQNVAKLQSIANNAVDICIHCVDMQKINEKFANVQQKTHVSTAALIKFELPNIFSDLDRILYLDSDIVVKSKFLEIFSTDLSGCYLAASYEFWKYLKDLIYKPSNLKKDDFFFNSGVMLFNLKRMRDDSISEKLWDYKLNCAKTKLMDQESFNEVCKGFVKPLSIEWNLNPCFLEDEYIYLINKVYKSKFESADNLYESANVIHYVGKADKPWIYKNARKNQLWMGFYEKVYPEQKLVLKSFEINKMSFLMRIVNNIKEHGVIGFVNFLRYKLFLRKH